MNYAIFFLVTQAWCLARFLALLVGDLVPEGNDHWDNFLQLSVILDYVFAPVTSATLAAYIGSLIEDYLVEFRRLYPERKLTPKMHYMVFIPPWIERLTVYCLCVYVCTCVYKCMYVYMHVCMQVYMPVWMYIYSDW